MGQMDRHAVGQFGVKWIGMQWGELGEEGSCVAR